MRLALAGLVPALALVVLEAALRMAGFGHPTRYFVRMGDGRYYTTNRKFGWQFYPRETATMPHPIRMAAQKPEGAVRIFVLGESAAAGTPDPAFGFARILEVMLGWQYPARRFEVINAAMRGVNSHILLPIARECARHQPDLFIVYMGNNEAIGLHAPAPEGLSLTPHLALLRAIQAARSSKLGQLAEELRRGLGGSRRGRPAQQDMDYFRRHRLALDHPRRRAVEANFRANLQDLCRVARRSGAKVLVATVAVNLRDFPPLASLHRGGLNAEELAGWEAAYARGAAAEQAADWETALRHFSTAAAIDDHYAELRFRLGRCLLALGRVEEAREHFTAARDWDALQFRTDSHLNQIIREVAGGRAHEGIHLVDVEWAFATSALSEHGLPGEKLFHDYVHFNFEGDYLVAATFLSAAREALQLGPPASPAPTRNECAERLAFTAWDEVNVAAAMVEFLAKPPFLDQLEHAARHARAAALARERQSRLRPADFQRAIQTYRQALQRDPDDWQLRYNLAGLFLDLGDPGSAVPEFEAVVRLLPELQPLRLALGKALLQAGRSEEALAQFREAVRLDPADAAAREALRNAAGRAAGRGTPDSTPRRP